MQVSGLVWEVENRHTQAGQGHLRKPLLSTPESASNHMGVGRPRFRQRQFHFLYQDTNLSILPTSSRAWHGGVLCSLTPRMVRTFLPHRAAALPMFIDTNTMNE